MKQSYSYQKEVPEGVRWDRKKSPKPNLHVCGEDGIKRAIYNMKRGHAEKGSEKREKNKEKTPKETWKEKNCICLKEKPIVVSTLIHQ